MISVRVFLGRFDMRTMQARGGGPGGRAQGMLAGPAGRPTQGAGVLAQPCRGAAWADRRSQSRGTACVAPVARPAPNPPVPAVQAATALRPSGPHAPPSGGDGFTYEHLAGRDELWWDFVADTGDGGDPTYA